MRRIATLAGSALAVLIAPPLYLLLDLAVVGRLGGEQLAALAAATLVLGIISTQLTFLSYGTTARSARRFGSGDSDGAVDEGIQASWIAVGVGVGMVTVTWFLAPLVMSALVGDAGPDSRAVADDAADWLRIAVFGVPWILLSMAGNGWMRGVQDTRRPVIYVIAGLSVSTILVIGLVDGMFGLPRLGLHGSAVANLIGQTITGALFAGRVIAQVRGDPGRLRPRWHIMGAQLVMARDLIIRSASFQICFVSAAAVAARFGVASVAAHQLVLQLWEFLSLLLDSLAIAAQALVGAALGAGSARVASVVARRVTVVSVAVSVAISVLFALGVGLIPRIFTSDEGVLDEVAVAWWFFVAMIPIAGVVFALDGVLLGSGDAAFLRTATLIAALVGFLPLIWASLIFDWGLAGIWTGLVVFMVLRLAAVVWRIRSGRWRRTGVDT